MNEACGSRFKIARKDGKTNPGNRHARCRYVVLDVNRDPHARNALSAYGKACGREFPYLAADLRKIIFAMGMGSPPDRPARGAGELCAQVVPLNEGGIITSEFDDDDRHRGSYRKYTVKDRLFGDARAYYFVLDLDHDPFSQAALEAYAASCEQNDSALARTVRGWLDLGADLTSQPSA